MSSYKITEWKNLTEKGWKISEPYTESKQAEYVAAVTKELLTIPREKRKVSKEQAPSTAATLARTDAEQAEWLNRPLPDNWRAVEGALSLDEAVGWKDRDLSEISHIEAIRRRPKNSIGQSQESGSSKERKEAATHAFTYSPGVSVKDLTPEERERLMKLSGYTPPPPPIEEEEESKRSWLSNLFERLKLKPHEKFSNDYKYSSEKRGWVVLPSGKKDGE